VTIFAEFFFSLGIIANKLHMGISFADWKLKQIFCFLGLFWDRSDDLVS
jgi:hypothetical protein